MSYPWKKGAPRTVFISGGRSGIGRDLALRLAREGASVAIFNRSDAADALAALRAAAPDPQQRFLACRADVAEPESIAAAVQQAVQALGAPNLAINSAGIINALPFEVATAQDFERVVDINLKGSRHFAAAVLPHMGAGSHLVFVASLAALTGNYAYTAYCASKFGVRGLAEALRYELKFRDIDVSLCCPGEIMTPMVEEEQRHQHPVSAALKAFAGSARLEDAGPALLRGIARRRFEIVDGFRPGLTAFLSRHFPRLSRRVGDRIAARAMRQMAPTHPSEPAP